MKKNIAIIVGGNESEKHISLRGAKLLQKEIDSDKFNVNLVVMKGKEWVLQSPFYKEIPINKEDFTFSVNNYSKTQFDAALILVHGSPGEDGKLPAYFDMLHIKYASSGTFSSSISFNKYHCCNIIGYNNILVPRAILLKDNEAIRNVKIVEKLGLPCIVKPNSGNTPGKVFKVNKVEAIPEAIKMAKQISPDVLIEEFIPGQIVNCSLLKNSKTEIILPLAQVSQSPFFSNRNEETDQPPYIIPAPVSEEIEFEAPQLASRVYDILDCKGLVSISMVWHEDRLYFLDVRTIPYYHEKGVVYQQVQASKLNLKEVMNILLGEVLG